MTFHRTFIGQHLIQHIILASWWLADQGGAPFSTEFHSLRGRDFFSTSWVQRKYLTFLGGFYTVLTVQTTLTLDTVCHTFLQKIHHLKKKKHPHNICPRSWTFCSVLTRAVTFRRLLNDMMNMNMQRSRTSNCHPPRGIRRTVGQDFQSMQSDATCKHLHLHPL